MTTSSAKVYPCRPFEQMEDVGSISPTGNDQVKDLSVIQVRYVLIMMFVYMYFHVHVCMSGVSSLSLRACVCVCVHVCVWPGHVGFFSASMFIVTRLVHAYECFFSELSPLDRKKLLETEKQFEFNVGHIF